VSEVVRERGTSRATFAAVVIMISGGCGILEGHSLVATRTYCIAVWVLLVSHAILFDPPISHEGRPGSRAPTGPGQRTGYFPMEDS
jgi:hypothetical protein